MAIILGFLGLGGSFPLNCAIPPENNQEKRQILRTIVKKKVLRENNNFFTDFSAQAQQRKVSKPDLGFSF